MVSDPDVAPSASVACELGTSYVAVGGTRADGFDGPCVALCLLNPEQSPPCCVAVL